MLSRSRNGIDAMPRLVNNAASPDYLLVRAREKLSPFAIKIPEHYTGPGGLDSTEYAILVGILLELAGSSPTQDQLVAARGLFVEGKATARLGPQASIWTMRPIEQWYYYAITKTSSLAPLRLLSVRTCDAADYNRAIYADCSAWAEKAILYLKEVPGVLERICEHHGLEIKLKGEEDRRPQRTEEIHSQDELNTKAKKMKELQTESEFVAGLKRTSGEINQKEEPKFKRARMGEEGEGAGCPQPTTAAASKTVEDHTSLQPPTEQSGLQKLLHAAELKDSGFDALLQAAELSRNPQAVITEVGPPHAKSKRVEQTQGVEEHTRDLEDKLRSVSSALGAPLNMAIEDQGSSLPQSGSPIFRTAKVVDTTAQSPTSTTTGANQDDQAVRNGGIVPNTPIIIDLDDDEDDLDDEDDDEDNAVITHAGLQIE
ncbi:hypothetical protein IWZ01DRAFT_575649 [Phyllosticta capitalensis]